MVSIPTYTVHHLPGIWGASAGEFVPERWLVEEEEEDEGPPMRSSAEGSPSKMSEQEGQQARQRLSSQPATPKVDPLTPLARKSFIPFSHGPRACIGRNVAEMELCLILATVCWAFEFELRLEGQGVEGKGRWETREGFLRKPLGLRVGIRRRRRGGGDGGKGRLKGDWIRERGEAVEIKMG